MPAAAQQKNLLQSTGWDSVVTLGSNRLAGYKSAQAFLLTADGVQVSSRPYTAMTKFRGGRSLACDGDACGWIDTTGKTVVLSPLKNTAATARTAARNKAYAEEFRVFGASRSTSTLPCPTNIDFENGTLANWQTNVGTVSGITNTNVITLPATTWINNAGITDRHTLQDRTATLPSQDFYGQFAVNPSNGGRYSLKLGSDGNLGTCGSSPCPASRAEAARYVINVPANATDYSITFSYAVVLENPLASANLHKDFEQPRFTVKMYDPVTNDVIPCANFTFVASGPLPGFDTSAFQKSADAVVRTKAWSSVYVNMSKYAGKTFYLEFTTADCTRGGHFGYAYIDVIECGIAAKSQTRCAPAAITTLYGPPGFQGYQWYNAGFTGVVGSTQNVVINPAPPVGTQYWVVATPYPNTGCPTCDCRDTVKVEVQPNFPQANAGPDQSFCPGSRATIGAAPVPGLTYQWTPATGLANATAATTTTNGAVPRYVLQVTDTFGCSITDTVNVTVFPRPVVVFSANNASQCISGNRFVFSNASTVASGGMSYDWAFGDGITSTQKEPVHSYATPGTYKVWLRVKGDNGCADSLSLDVTVFTMPVLSIAGGRNYTICRGGNVQLNVSGADSYVWSPAKDLSCTACANPIASPTAAAVYFVEGSTAAGCRSNDSVRIQVVQPFTVQTSGGTVCLGDTVQLQARGADRYNWSPATGLNNTTLASPLASPKQSLTYTVVGHDNQNCFTDTAYATVLVAPVPTVNLGPDLTLSTGSTVTLQGTITNGPVSWLWSPRTALSCSTCPSPTADVKADVLYKVVVTNNFGCTASDSISIKAFCAEGQVYIPNAFTPDGDGVNDVFFVQGRGISAVKTLRIFNRWGELLFEKLNVSPNDMRQGWDGKIRGIVGPPDVFVYTAEVVCSNGSVFFFKGNVSVLK